MSTDATHPSWDAWDFNDHITCPFCLTENEEYTEYPDALQNDGDTATDTCHKCGKDFEVTLCATYTYATAPIEHPAPAATEEPTP